MNRIDFLRAPISRAGPRLDVERLGSKFVKCVHMPLA